MGFFYAFDFLVFFTYILIVSVKVIKPNTLYKWAERRFGKSKCVGVKYCNNKKRQYAEYSFTDKMIRINLRFVKNNTQVYRVMAHEWTHAQQSMSWYFRYHDIYGYSFNPYEIRARENERKLWRN